MKIYTSRPRAVPDRARSAASPGPVRWLGLLALPLAFTVLFGLPGLDASAQTASSVCRTISVTALPHFPSDIFCREDYGMAPCQSTECCFLLQFASPASGAKFTFQRKNPDGSYTDVSPQNQNQNSFTVSADGKYRAVVSLPEYNTVYCKKPEDPAAKVFTTAGQFVGWLGQRYLVASNDVWAGTNPPQPDFIFPECTGGIDDWALDYNPNGTHITMDATATDPALYDFYWVAIFELSAPYRYKSSGWVTGTLTNNSYDLYGLWNDQTGYNFTPHTYKVQFATGSNQHCNPPDWNAREHQFFVCPVPGGGCRFGNGEQQELPTALFPNPANEYFAFPVETIPDLDGFTLTIQDALGRMAKTVEDIRTNRVDVSDLENGYYVVSLLTGGKKLFSKKLVIQH